MKKMFGLIILFLFLINGSFAQKYLTKTGKINFFSKSPLENIEGHNKQVNAALDITTGDFVFKVLMKSFEFEKALMQEHFNENYIESDKYPNSIFSGKVVNLSEIDFTKEGKYNAVVEGNLTIHGVTKHIKESGVFEVKDGKIRGTSQFDILVEDFQISIPNAVINNVAKSIQVTVDVLLEKL
jgi:polyisoprenoid-binding protein YceI